MSAIGSVELSKQECELLIRGLRYIRSALMLDIRDPEPKQDSQRTAQLTQISALADRLSELSDVS